MSLITFWLKPRQLNFAVFLVCLLAILLALAMQYRLQLDPCPLCIFQRVAVMVAGVICLLAALHGPKVWGRRIYAFLTLLAAVVGSGIAMRHLWLQHLPPDQVPSCGPGLDYMLDAFPFHEVVSMVLHGSGECADIQGIFLGLTIPGWTLVLFVLLIAVSGFQLLRPR